MTRAFSKTAVAAGFACLLASGSGFAQGTKANEPKAAAAKDKAAAAEKRVEAVAAPKNPVAPGSKKDEAAAPPAATPDAAKGAVPGAPPPAPAPTAGAPSAIPRKASAQDVGLAARKVCDVCNAAGATAACTEVKKLPEQPSDCEDPTSPCYESFFVRRNIDLRSVVSSCGAASADLEKRIGLADERGAATLMLAAVGGLQTFLEERAKAEAIGYTIDQLKGRLCTANHKAYLAATCTLLESEDVSFDEATVMRLKEALLADLNQLPAIFVAKLPAAAPNEQALRFFGQSGAETALSFAQSRIGLSEIPATWADKDAALFGQSGLELTCSVVASGDALQQMPSGCWAFLLPEIGRAAIDQRPAPTAEGVAKVIEAAAVSYCKVYGPDGQKDGGRCLLPGDGEDSLLAGAVSMKRVVSAELARWKRLRKLRDAGTALEPAEIQLLEQLKANGRERVFEKLEALGNLRELVIASLRFVELAKRSDKLAEDGTPASEIVTRLLPDLAASFDSWNAALQSTLGDLPKADKKMLAGVSFALHTSGAVASRNYPAMLGHLAKAFAKDGPLEAAKLPPAAMHSLGFAARLAAVQKPEDAKKVFEEEAAPLGSYKVKYDREKVTIAVNAYIGPFFATGRHFDVKGTDPDTDFGVVVRPLSAPLGIDFTLASSEHVHWGLLASVIDPFAVGTVDEDANAEDFDWGALLTPGLQTRLGLGGSPFTVLAGLTWQPLARSKDTCTSGSSADPCWKGALQVGAGIAIDVPLIVLR